MFWRFNLKDFSLKLLELTIEDNMLGIGVRVQGPYTPIVKEPKLAVIFSNGKETRRLPLLIQAYYPDKDLEGFNVFAKYDFMMDYLFYNMPVNNHIDFRFEFAYGTEVITDMTFALGSDLRTTFEDYKCKFNKEMSLCSLDAKKPKKADDVRMEWLSPFGKVVDAIWTFIFMIISIPMMVLFAIEGVLSFFHLVDNYQKNDFTGIKYILNHVRIRESNFLRRGIGFRDGKERVMRFAYFLGSLRGIDAKKVLYLSNRRCDLTGNFEFVDEYLKKDESLKRVFILDDTPFRDMSISNAFRYGFHYASAKVVLVDDYVDQLYRMPRRQGTTMIQMWHACGAFKTFGYSRLGKPGGQRQTSPNHRNYDYCLVSSQEIAKFYAEGFGISLEKPAALGIPRTDIFFDDDYAARTRKAFYEKFPKLSGRKILLFAPTFRGNGKMTGFYPVEKFDLARAYEELGGEYAIIVKHHPFVQDRSVIPEELKDDIIDLSDDSEINDLLFVTDLLITDYSSVIFEAALLEIPMLFFAYDLQRYISTRGFYYEYEEFVPGKIVGTFDKAIKAIKAEDFEKEKIAAFRTRFFDHLDGQSSKRAVDLIYEALEK